VDRRTLGSGCASQTVRIGGSSLCHVVARYHDNFDDFNSQFQPWNSVNFEPRHDIVEFDHELRRGHFNESPLKYTEHDFRFTNGSELRFEQSEKALIVHLPARSTVPTDVELEIRFRDSA
jgi:hypothetical protein